MGIKINMENEGSGNNLRKSWENDYSKWVWEGLLLKYANDYRIGCGKQYGKFKWETVLQSNYAKLVRIKFIWNYCGTWVKNKDEEWRWKMIMKNTMLNEKWRLFSKIAREIVTDREYGTRQRKKSRK
jgi:hypothetical protein